MREFISLNLSDEIVNNELSSIIKQYRNQLCTSKMNKINSKIICVDYKNDELKSIISYLKKTIGEDLEKEGEIKVATGCKPYQGSMSNIIKYDNSHINTYFWNHTNSKFNESKGWMEFDFCKRKINLKSYTLRTSKYDKNDCYHPKIWRSQK